MDSRWNGSRVLSTQRNLIGVYFWTFSKPNAKCALQESLDEFVVCLGWCEISLCRHSTIGVWCCPCICLPYWAKQTSTSVGQWTKTPHLFTSWYGWVIPQSGQRLDGTTSQDTVAGENPGGLPLNWLQWMWKVRVENHWVSDSFWC